MDDKEFWNLVKEYQDYSALGHMDLITRYDRQGENPFEKVEPIISEILETVSADGKGIERNTSCYRYGLKDSMPPVDILRLYL